MDKCIMSCRYVNLSKQHHIEEHRYSYYVYSLNLYLNMLINKRGPELWGRESKKFVLGVSVKGTTPRQYIFITIRLE